MKRSPALVDLAIALWFVVAGGGFFAPYLGVPGITGAATALYALFLIGSVATLALRLARRSASER